MKKIFIGITLLVSMSSFANTVTYSNDDGCLVEKEQRKNGVVLYVTKGNEYEIVGYGNQYSFGSFTHCADKKMSIDVSTLSKDKKVIKMSCSAHKNGHKTTRGRVDISLTNGQLSELKIDGEVEGLFFWKQDVKIECLNLVQKN